MQKKIKEENEKKLQKIKVILLRPRNPNKSYCLDKSNLNAKPCKLSSCFRENTKTSSGSMIIGSSIRSGRMRQSDSKLAFLTSKTPYSILKFN